MRNRAFNNNFNNAMSFNQTQYDEFKNICVEEAPIIKVINIGSFNLINSKTVEISQTVSGERLSANFTITKTAFQNLLKSLGLTYGIFDIFLNTFGSEISATIFDQVRNTLKLEKPDTQIAISIKDDKIISVFKYRGGDIISNNTYFNLVETAMNGLDNDGMRIKNLAVTPDGDIAISLLNDKWNFDLGSGLSDEYFSSGLTLIKSNDKVSISPFNERLVCTNGMQVVNKLHTTTLNSTDDKELRKFFEFTKNYGNFRCEFENDFTKRVNRLSNTNASYNELVNMHNAIDRELKDDEYSKKLLNSDFNIHEFNNEYKAKFGIDLKNQTTKFQQKVNTGQSLWDLTNKLTFIGSNTHKHDYQFENGNDSIFRIQREAGNVMFKEHHDLGETIPQLF